MSIESPDETRTASVDAGGSVSDTAKNVTSHAGEQAKQVADEAKDQVREVAAEAKDHALDLLDQTRTQARRQAEESTKHMASGLHSLGDQIQALREGRAEDAGAVAGYADQARRRLDDVASRLDRDGLNGVASDLAAFARRRPGLFLVSCAGAGFALARLVRSGSASDDGGADRSRPPGADRSRPPSATLLGAAVPEAEADPGLSVGVPASGLP
jgi:hypothetical protein